MTEEYDTLRTYKLAGLQRLKTFKSYPHVECTTRIRY